MRWPDLLVEPMTRPQARRLLVLPIAQQADLPTLLAQALQAIALADAASPESATPPSRLTRVADHPPAAEWHLVAQAGRKADLLRQWPRAMAHALACMGGLQSHHTASAPAMLDVPPPLERMFVHANEPLDPVVALPEGSPRLVGGLRASVGTGVGTLAIARPAAHPLMQRLWGWASDPECSIHLLLAEPSGAQGQQLSLGLSMLGRAQDRVFRWPAAVGAPGELHPVPRHEAPRLTVHTREGEVELAGRRCRLAPAELFVYTLLALRRQQQAGIDAGFAGKPGAVLIDDERWVGFDGPWLERTQALLPACRFQTVPTEQWRSRVSCINRKLRAAFPPDLVGPALVIGPASTGRRDGRYGLLHAQPASIHIR